VQRQADLERAGAEGGEGFASSVDGLGPGRQPSLPMAGLSPALPRGVLERKVQRRLLQRKQPADPAASQDDAVFGGVVRAVKADSTSLVADPAKPKDPAVAALGKGDQVTPTDLGGGRDFNRGAEGTGAIWWKVVVKSGAAVGKEGWLQASSMESILKVKDKGKEETAVKVGDGQVDVATGRHLEKSGADDGDNNFSLTYTGKDAGDAHWLQFIWREVVGADDKGAAVPVKGSITSTGGTYDLTDNGAFDKNGTPGKKNYNTDCPNASDPFYEAFGEADRTAESTTMIDLPAARTDKVIEAFDKGARKVASRAHFHTFLVKGKKVTFATNINVTWTFLSKAEATGGPRGVHTVKDSGAASGLPATIAERFHEQYPAFKDIG
jgi:hypothetical protein